MKSKMKFFFFFIFSLPVSQLKANVAHEHREVGVRSFPRVQRGDEFVLVAISLQFAAKSKWDSILQVPLSPVGPISI